MSRRLRLALIACAGLSFAGTALAQTADPAAVTFKRDRVWAQTFSDLPANPEIRFGVLPNGMRYAVMHNATPSRQVSLRMRIGSGSLEETDAEQGLAHFLEHMAFKGSTHVPNGDMIKILERHGLAFGADTNAQTGFNATTFELDLPESDPDSLSTGLMLLRDIGGELSLPAGPMNSERGVVLSEERLRDTPEYEAFKTHWQFQFKGQLLADRLPIGKVDVISTAPPELMRTLYRANYRPNRATLIAVGDFDPAVMEADIKARFSDWAPVGPETATPKLGVPTKRGEAAQVIVRPGISPSLDVDWMAPFDATPDSFAKEKHDTIETVALAVLNRRLEHMAHSDHPPFLGAGFSRSNVERSAKVANLHIVFRPGEWRDALSAAIGAQRQALKYGVSADEIAREVTELRVRLRDAAAGASTRRTPTLADEIVRSVDDQQVETAPSEDLAIFEEFVRGLTPAQVDAAMAGAFEGQGPLVSLASPTPIDGDETALTSAFAQASAAPVSAPVQLAGKTWTHTHFGAPGKVVEQSKVDDLGVTFVRFANGVRLTVKPTRFQQDNVEIAVHFGLGRLELPKDKPSPWWAASAFAAGGLNDLNYEQLQQVLADKSVSAALSVGDDSFALSGVTRPADLDVQMQMLAAYMTVPGWRQEAFDRARNMTSLALSELDSTPQGVETRDLAALEHSGDPRWKLPTPAELQTQTLDQVKAMLTPGLTSGPIEVVMVGDISVAQAIASVASTFGALPARAPEPMVDAGGDRIRFPAASADYVVRTHKGRGDQAIGYIAWPTTDFFADMQQSRVMNVTAEVMESRLLDQIRIAEGATYSPNIQSNMTQDFPGFGYTYASVETPPAKLASFYANVDRITADMAKTVTADELERARKPHAEGIVKAQQSNGYWVAMLHQAQTDPRRLTLIRDSVPGYAKVTTQDVQRAAATYLTANRAWRFEIEPVNPSPTAGPDAAAIAPPLVKTPAVPGQPA
ncbi:MAG: M16 family metallopeptidase, partial [Caulobacteraceae bacterium]